jgi:hypothetical protein
MAIKRGRSFGLGQPEDVRRWLRVLPDYFTPNEHLQFIRAWLNDRITKEKYGFLPVRIEDIAPLIEDPIAIAKYVTKQLIEPSERFTRFAKGTHMIVLPTKVPKTMTRAMSWNNPKARRYRKNCALVAGYLGLDRETVKARLGSDWMKKIGSFLNEIRKRNPGWPDYVDPYFDPGEFCRRKVIELRW